MVAKNSSPVDLKPLLIVLLSLAFFAIIFLTGMLIGTGLSGADGLTISDAHSSAYSPKLGPATTPQVMVVGPIVKVRPIGTPSVVPSPEAHLLAGGNDFE